MVDRFDAKLADDDEDDENDDDDDDDDDGDDDGDYDYVHVKRGTPKTNKAHQS